MIVVTGAAGFIGSCLLGELQRHGWQDLVAVDDFSRADKAPNLLKKKLTAKVDRKDFFTWLDANEKLVQFIFHLGAKTDTTLFDKAVFDELNVRYSQRVWEACVKYGIPLVYASSAATYGGGELGYSDQDDALPFRLKPLNPYGESKNTFNQWALSQEKKPFFWAGLNFFNVYGPNEYHKGRMASVVTTREGDPLLGLLRGQRRNARRRRVLLRAGALKRAGSGVASGLRRRASSTTPAAPRSHSSSSIPSRPRPGASVWWTTSSKPCTTSAPSAGPQATRAPTRR